MSVTDTAPAGIEVRDVIKRFGDFTAVDNVSIDVDHREFFSVLGPSGCGKTTLMRMIAGFERPSSGEIRLMGTNVERLPSNQRDLNMVFQNYALFPHLSVFGNVAFELKVRKVERKTISQRVNAMLELVQLNGLEKRKPSELSGGQRQRVALARALVGNPSVLLLDEPLGALDQKLRKDMQVELKRLQREVGITFFYVTHDQEEALTMSDHVAVMRSGNVLQVDAPEAIYSRPNNRFVANFIGRSNFLDGTVEELSGSDIRLSVPRLGIVNVRVDGGGFSRGDNATVSVRPERLRFVDRNGDNLNVIRGSVRERLFAGNDTEYFVTLANGTEVMMRHQNTVTEGGPAPSPGDEVALSWDVTASVLLKD